MKKLILSAVVLAGLSATAALAQTPTSFADVDSDTNGELSFAELQVAWPDLTQEEFSAADADLSSGISTTELGALQPSATPEAAAPADAAPTEAAPVESLND